MPVPICIGVGMGTETRSTGAPKRHPPVVGRESRPGKEDVRTWELRGSSSGIWRLVDQKGGRLEGVSRTCPAVARVERMRNVAAGGRRADGAISLTLTGPAVKLRLWGQNHLWETMYARRDETQDAGYAGYRENGVGDETQGMLQRESHLHTTGRLSSTYHEEQAANKRSRSHSNPS